MWGWNFVFIFLSIILIVVSIWVLIFCIFFGVRFGRGDLRYLNSLISRVLNFLLVIKFLWLLLFLMMDCNLWNLCMFRVLVLILVILFFSNCEFCLSFLGDMILFLLMLLFLLVLIMIGVGWSSVVVFLLIGLFFNMGVLKVGFGGDCFVVKGFLYIFRVVGFVVVEIGLMIWGVGLGGFDVGRGSLIFLWLLIDGIVNFFFVWEGVFDKLGRVFIDFRGFGL